MESQSPSDHSAGGPTVNVPAKDSISTLFIQMLAFKAATGNALTIFRAGFAFTMTTLPKTSLFPAFVAGFVRIFNRAKPGTVKTPVFFDSSFGHGSHSRFRLHGCHFAETLKMIPQKSV